ncbi:hypothetical protein BATDEDRAFT_28892 [Batrachochytrium dendrobatidis JAM81]|uniref:Uncharacterized protein n=1 Tax=Batrachochytrium dendrobatidis (strain JAM81 / FGSC 10211) TaxID=684364 RepID=F4PFJ1_BATDJ|nr:uncharacterized protein BATDEDRAFT_28892 [Batrachochytrium dendrobatidis JAM81]EGF76002.1 hypothetical protein BATDEDRAFT_28892 [Batrachochytrium dendrobatidis JAM81]|eukprot:XP_006683374.1 hypothetical protein BATDEDRAFT_28892 [Batrachochytrium dendrobatidis JAM81]
MKSINFSVLATAFALSSSVYAAPPMQQKNLPPGPDTTATISNEKNTESRDLFVSELVELAGVELQSTGKLVIDDKRYDPTLMQKYFVSGAEIYHKEDYWGRDALVAVLLEHIPEAPGMKGQPVTPTTPDQPGLLGGLFSAMWSGETPSDAPKSLEQKIADYYGLTQSFSGEYLLWIGEVFEYLSKLEIQTNNDLLGAFEDEQEAMQHATSAPQDGSQFELVKSIKDIMAKHQESVQEILKNFTKQMNDYLRAYSYSTIKFKPILGDWIDFHNEMDVMADTLLE